MGWIDKGKPTHRCPTPGIWARLLNNVHPWARWKCDECGEVWEWFENEGEKYWRATSGLPRGSDIPMFDKDGNPNPPPPPPI